MPFGLWRTKCLVKLAEESEAGQSCVVRLCIYLTVHTGNQGRLRSFYFPNNDNSSKLMRELPERLFSVFHMQKRVDETFSARLSHSVKGG